MDVTRKCGHNMSACCCVLSMQEEARALVESGVVELNLIAEDTNQYGQDR
jgi:tRNA A37 methylthiotransferase MiaB